MGKADELIELVQQACEDSDKMGFSTELSSFVKACQRIREVVEVDHDLENFLNEYNLALELAGIAGKIVGPKIIFSDRVLLEANLCGGDIEYKLPAIEGTPFKESIGDIEVGHHFDEVKAIVDRNVYPRARTILLIPEPFHKNLPSVAPEDVAVPESLWVGRHSTYETNLLIFRSPNGRSRNLTPVAIIEGPFNFEPVEGYEAVVDEKACRELCRLWYENYGPCRDLVLEGLLIVST